MTYIGGSANDRVSQVMVADFTGGLNLAANPFQLEAGDSPNMLDVDPDPKGGVQRRKAVEQLIPSVSGTVDGLWVYDSTSGLRRMAAVRSGANTVVKNLEGTPTAIHTFPAGRCRSVTFNDRCYVVSESAQPIRWDGSSGATLSEVWTALPPDPSDVVTNGAMPRASLIAVWQNCVWIADTNEADGEHPNRVRFSWPGHSEHWSQDNYFDLDVGENNDRITALVPHGERLLVFKRNAVYAIHGYDPDSFERLPLSKASGTISQESVCNAGFDVFFVDWPNGVYHIPFQSTPTLISAKIDPIFNDGLIPHAERDNIYCGWAGKKVWVGVPWTEAEQGRTFVYDLITQSWTAYSVNVHYAQDVYPSNEANYAFGVVAHTSAPTTWKLADLRSSSTQDLGSYHVPAYYQTNWFTADDPIIMKRFLRPGFVFSGPKLQVAAYFDFTTNAKKHFQVAGSGTATSGQWGQNWGAMEWTEANDSNDLIVANGRRTGNGRAMSLLLSSPSDENWSVSAVVYKFTPRRRRN